MAAHEGALGEVDDLVFAWEGARPDSAFARFSRLQATTSAFLSATTAFGALSAGDSLDVLQARCEAVSSAHAKLAALATALGRHVDAPIDDALSAYGRGVGEWQAAAQGLLGTAALPSIVHLVRCVAAVAAVAPSTRWEPRLLWEACAGAVTSAFNNAGSATGSDTLRALRPVQDESMFGRAPPEVDARVVSGFEAARAAVDREYSAMMANTSAVSIPALQGAVAAVEGTGANAETVLRVALSPMSAVGYMEPMQEAVDAFLARGDVDSPPGLGLVKDGDALLQRYPEDFSNDAHFQTTRTRLATSLQRLHTRVTAECSICLERTAVCVACSGIPSHALCSECVAGLMTAGCDHDGDFINPVTNRDGITSPPLSLPCPNFRHGCVDGGLAVSVQALGAHPDAVEAYIRARSRHDIEEAIREQAVARAAEEEAAIREADGDVQLSVTRALLELAITRGLSVPCPQCGLATQKNAACIHMSCTQCQTAFCYACGLTRPQCSAGPHCGARSIFLENAPGFPDFPVDDLAPGDRAVVHFHLRMAAFNVSVVRDLAGPVLTDRALEKWPALTHNVLGGHSLDLEVTEPPLFGRAADVAAQREAAIARFRSKAEAFLSTVPRFVQVAAVGGAAAGAGGAPLVAPILTGKDLEFYETTGCASASRRAYFLGAFPSLHAAVEAYLEDDGRRGGRPRPDQGDVVRRVRDGKVCVVVQDRHTGAPYKLRVDDAVDSRWYAEAEVGVAPPLTDFNDPLAAVGQSVRVLHRFAADGVMVGSGLPWGVEQRRRCTQRGIISRHYAATGAVDVEFAQDHTLPMRFRLEALTSDAVGASPRGALSVGEVVAVSSSLGVIVHARGGRGATEFRVEVSGQVRPGWHTGHSLTRPPPLPSVVVPEASPGRWVCVLGPGVVLPAMEAGGMPISRRLCGHRCRVVDINPRDGTVRVEPDPLAFPVPAGPTWLFARCVTPCAPPPHVGMLRRPVKGDIVRRVCDGRVGMVVTDDKRSGDGLPYEMLVEGVVTGWYSPQGVGVAVGLHSILSEGARVGQWVTLLQKPTQGKARRGMRGCVVERHAQRGVLRVVCEGNRWAVVPPAAVTLDTPPPTVPLGSLTAGDVVRRVADGVVGVIAADTGGTLRYKLCVDGVTGHEWYTSSDLSPAAVVPCTEAPQAAVGRHVRVVGKRVAHCIMVCTGLQWEKPQVARCTRRGRVVSVDHQRGRVEVEFPAPHAGVDAFPPYVLVPECEPGVVAAAEEERRRPAPVRPLVGQAGECCVVM